MTEGTTARPAFLDLPDHDRPVGPPRCRWSQISDDYCFDPMDMKRPGSLMLCRKHAEEVARRTGFEPYAKAIENARKQVQFEIDQLELKILNLRQELARNTQPAPRSKRSRPKDGLIYYIRIGWNIKIGWTSNLERRMKDYPPDTLILAVHPGTEQDERRIHKKFAHLITDGREWFPAAPQILEHIESVKREHGEPQQITARRKPDPIKGPRLDKYVGTRGRSVKSHV